MLKAGVTSDGRVLLHISVSTGETMAVEIPPVEASQFAFAIERAAIDADRQQKFLGRLRPQEKRPE